MSLSAETQAALDGPPRSFILDNEVYEVLPDEWWPALRAIRLEDDWAFAFLLGVTHQDDGFALAERLVEDETLAKEDLVPIAERLVEKATGRMWWVAARLAVITDVHWAAIDGRMLSRGLDLMPLLKCDPSRALNIVRGMLYEHADEKRIHELDNLLERPPRAALVQRRTKAEDAKTFENAFNAAASL